MEGDVAVANFEVATGFKYSHMAILRKPLEICIWNLENKAGKKTLICACLFS